MHNDYTKDMLVPTIGLLLGRPPQGWRDSLRKAVDLHGWEKFSSLLYANRISLRGAYALKEHFPDLGEKALNKIIAAHEPRVKKHIEYMKLLSETLDLEFVFIKSVDNFPDLGHDIDILTRDKGTVVKNAFLDRGFRMAKQTLAERIADKMNFTYGDFRPVEAHCGRLGEVGEHTLLPAYILANRERIQIDATEIWGPDYASRIMLIVLQRMYRHFNLRACDALNAITWIRQGLVAVPRVYELSARFGILPGTSGFFRLLNEIYCSYYGEKIVDTEPIANELYCQRKCYRFSQTKFFTAMFGQKMTWSFLNGSLGAFARELLVVPLAALALAYLKVTKKAAIW